MSKFTAPRSRCKVMTAMLVMGTIIGLLVPPTTYAQQHAVSETRIVYCVLLDDSASMQKRPENPTAVTWLSKIDEVKRQMATFIASLPNGTEVRFFAFAKELHRGPQVVISSDADREKLFGFVNALSAEGRETRLWRSLDSVMAEAAELAKREPGMRVRVIGYSDLQDNDPDRTEPSVVLAKYRSLLRQSAIQLTYICIGFELGVEQRKVLENDGVQVRTALAPEDVIPLQAEFRVVPEEIRLGDRMTVVDDSIGVIRDRVVGWGDGADGSRGRSPTHVYQKPGEYTVRLTVTSSTGQTSTATQKVRVVLPAAPVAAFKISADRAAVNAPVLLVNESTGVGCRFTWDFGNRRTATETNPRATWAQPGEYTIRLTVTDSYGRVDTAEQDIRVEGPKPPVAAMVVPKRATLGEPISLIDRSTGEVETRTWLVNGREVSSDRDCTINLTEVGIHAVRLLVKGPGGSDITERTVEVSPIPQPTASFVIGTPEPRLGEAVILTDTSTGDIETVTWDLPGRDSPLVVDYADGGARSIKYAFADIGEQEVRLHVRGGGGEAEIAQKLNVRTRLARPEPAVTLEVVESGRDNKLVVFNNRSKGSVVQTEYDFGDGSPTVRVQGVQDVRHKYRPGNYMARVRIIGPREFAPELVDIPINIRQPLPAWLWHLVWLAPAAIALVGGTIYVILWCRKRQEDLRLSMLVGTFNYKPKGDPLAPYTSVEFDGKTTEERVPLNESTQAIVRATSDPLTNQIEHSVEVVDGNGTQLGPVPLAENDRTTVGEYEFNLVQA